MNFSPMRCGLAVQDVGFYADALTEGVKVAILGTLQAIVFLKLTKVCTTTIIGLMQASFSFMCVCEKKFT